MTSSPHETVAANTRAELARQRVRHQDVAAALGLSQQAASRRLNGEVPFDSNELPILAEMLGLEVADLYRDDRPAMTGT